MFSAYCSTITEQVFGFHLFFFFFLEFRVFYWMKQQE